MNNLPGRHRADSVSSAATSLLPPDAAARDAAKRGATGSDNTVLSSDGFEFITRGVSNEERAAVIAVLTQARTEETEQVRRVERREHQPWARSQRVPRAFGELQVEG